MAVDGQPGDELCGEDQPTFNLAPEVALQDVASERSEEAAEGGTVKRAVDRPRRAKALEDQANGDDVTVWPYTPVGPTATDGGGGEAMTPEVTVENAVTVGAYEEAEGRTSCLVPPATEHGASSDGDLAACAVEALSSAEDGLRRADDAFMEATMGAFKLGKERGLELKNCSDIVRPGELFELLASGVPLDSRLEMAIRKMHELEEALIEAEDVLEVARADARNVGLGERARRRPPRPKRRAKADAEGGQPKGRKAKPAAPAKAAGGVPKRRPR